MVIAWLGADDYVLTTEAGGRKLTKLIIALLVANSIVFCIPIVDVIGPAIFRAIQGQGFHIDSGFEGVSNIAGIIILSGIAAFGLPPTLAAWLAYKERGIRIVKITTWYLSLVWTIVLIMQVADLYRNPEHMLRQPLFCEISILYLTMLCFTWLIHISLYSKPITPGDKEK
jgi:hypothetical protein